MIHLPDEILLYILQSLPSLSDYTHKADFEDYKQTSNTLANICQASRVLRNLAEPLLYRAYIEDGNDCDRRRGGSQDVCRTTTRLQSFLKTLIHRPDLAAKVEYLRLADLPGRLEDSPPNIEIGKMFAQASDDVPAIEDTSDWTGKQTQQSHVFRTNWRRHLQDDSETEGAEVALLLTLVPSLKTLDLGASERNTGLCVQGLFRDIVRTDKWKLDLTSEHREVLVFNSQGVNASSRLHVLTSLKTITLSAEEEALEDWHFITLLAAIPSLDTLSVNGEVEPFRPNVSRRWPFDHIQNLSFKGCTLSNLDLRSFVTSCRSLQSLRIKFSAHKEDMNINLETLLSYLHDSSETLHELQLFKPSGYPATIITPDAFDLRPFTQLKGLEINFYFLIDPSSHTEPSFTNLLPTSLEDIYFRMGDNRFSKHLRVLSEEYESFPNLKIVDIGVDEMPNIQAMDQEEVDWKLALNDCAKALRKAGIDCNVPIEGTHFNLSCGDD
ncbi:hypothetical protein D6D13_05160 [Aureobasidium pullulans]|uniref:Uncharacterized protein n=1 Tax=Aureobasidium pullulans TaxID=5580 RepID=A0A4S9CWM1_AURPU|nr:hypothetical protein D6D13_05160 [Aureobasidium pullulans]